MHWELRLLLYAGILIFTTGLSLLIAKHFASIGHLALLAAIALGCAGCFAYCLRLGGAFSPERLPAPDAAYDYVLLLGCLLLGTFQGYLELRYQLLAGNWNLWLLGAGPWDTALRGRDKLPRGSLWSLETVRLAAWAGTYLNVNLYAHRLLWREWLGWTAGSRTWSDPLCAALTALLPLTALALGIGHRDRALLWFAVAAGLVSILTFKYYVHLGHLAEELTAAGLFLTALAFALMRWLRNGTDRRRGAFTAEPLLEPRLYGLDAEALAAIQPLATEGRPRETGGFHPGGGRFGGGGASGGY